MNYPLVSVIVVNYNGKEYLDECLLSLKKQTYVNFEVILVDNASADDSIDFIEKNYPNFVELIKNPINYGFAKGNNMGIRASRGKYIITLNNDTRSDPQWIEELVGTAESNEKIGMCASKIYLNQDDHQEKIIDSVGMLIYPDGISKQRGWLEKDVGQYDKAEKVLLPSACAALYRREMLNEIGLFDESFFAYCEDTDLGLRGRVNGWECVFVPKAVVHHYYSGYWGGHLARKIFLIERNRILMVFKIFPVWMIFLSFYYYFKRCLFHLYGLIIKRGEVTSYSQKIGLLGFIAIVCKAHFLAFLLLPSIMPSRNRIKIHARISSMDFKLLLFGKHHISAKEIALKRQN